MVKNIKNKSINFDIEHDQLVNSIEIVDRYTGEVTIIEPKVPVIGKRPRNGMKKFNLMERYHRRNTAAWYLLSTQTSKKEYDLAIKMSDMSSAFVGSLQPISDDTSSNELSKILDADRRTVKDSIDRLFKLGVIGKFKVHNSPEQYKKYWIFNPYLSFNGDVIKEEVAALFEDTYFAKV